VVTDSRAQVRAHQLRALNRPLPVDVVAGSRGEPRAVRIGTQLRKVERVKDRWRIDDEWWREPIHRMYYLVEFADGTQETLYQDLVDQTWYKQREWR